MNVLVSAVCFVAEVLSDVLLVQVLRCPRRLPGSRILLAAWLFFMGLGVASVVVHDSLHGHHPLLTLGFALGTGFGLAAFASGLET